MAVTIQIIGVGGLLLAWIWVLGRPLFNGAIRRSDYRNLDRSYHLDHATVGVGAPGGGADAIAVGVKAATSAASRRSRLLSMLIGWWQSPIAIRRRQFMLATLFASLASFLMAIALRGRFFYLFLMMTSLLVVHLLIASRVGGVINRNRRSVAVSEAKERIRVGAEPRGMQIRAPQAKATSFDKVNELVSMLAESDEAKAEPIVVTSYVSDLIDMEWGDVEDAVSDELATEEPTTDELVGEEPVAEEPALDEFEVESAGEVEESPTTEAIFTRAVKDSPVRPRRKAQPIYIESQLDDDDSFSPAKAVNDR